MMNPETIAWLEEKIKPLLNIAAVDDSKFASVGNLWSVRKELFIDQYIPPFVNIIQKRRSRWHYFDPFCGSGIIKLELPNHSTVNFPGSPMIAYRQHELGKRFTEYHLSDADKKSISSLKKLLDDAYPSNAVTPTTQKFSESYKFVDNLDREADAVLAIIDPKGYKDIPWEYIKHVLKFPTLDAVITVMTSGIHRNIANKSQDDSGLTEFFGSEDWQQFDSGHQVVEKYAENIKNHTKKDVRILSIDNKDQNLYDLLLITKSKGGMNAMEHIHDKLQNVSIEEITDCVARFAKNHKTLEDYF